MPGVRARHHFAFGELAHLFADRGELVVGAGAADGEVVDLAQQGHEPRAALFVAGRDQALERTGEARRHRCDM